MAQVKGEGWCDVIAIFDESNKILRDKWKGLP